jgi:hypothetical protein
VTDYDFISVEDVREHLSGMTEGALIGFIADCERDIGIWQAKTKELLDSGPQLTAEQHREHRQHARERVRLRRWRKVAEEILSADSQSKAYSDLEGLL